MFSFIIFVVVDEKALDYAYHYDVYCTAVARKNTRVNLWRWRMMANSRVEADTTLLPLLCSTYANVCLSRLSNINLQPKSPTLRLV